MQAQNQLSTLFLQLILNDKCTLWRQGCRQTPGLTGVKLKLLTIYPVTFFSAEKIKQKETPVIALQ